MAHGVVGPIAHPGNRCSWSVRRKRICSLTRMGSASSLSSRYACRTSSKSSSAMRLKSYPCGPARYPWRQPPDRWIQVVLDLLHRIALPAALDAHGGIFTDVAVGQAVGAEVHGLLGGGQPLVPQAGQLQRHRVHAHGMAAGPLQDRHIGGDGVQIVAVGDLVGIRQLIWLKLQPMTQQLVPRTFSAPSLHIRTTSS